MSTDLSKNCFENVLLMVMASEHVTIELSSLWRNRSASALRLGRAVQVRVLIRYNFFHVQCLNLSISLPSRPLVHTALLRTNVVSAFSGFIVVL